MHAAPPVSSPLAVQLRLHEDKLAEIARELSRLDEASDARRLFLTAQLTRHRIDLALLASRLAT